MNVKKRTMIATVLTLGLFTLGESALAQSDCKKVKAELLVADCSASPWPGTITNGGDLNGTTLMFFTFGGCFPAPTIATFGGHMTVTTEDGQLKTSFGELFDTTTFLTTFLAHINPSASTGRFAGATGTLFLSGKAFGPPCTMELEITGEICVAK